MAAPPVLKIQLMLKGRPIKNYTFIKNVVTIGRDPSSDVFLDNMGVSRNHARIEFRDGQYRLMDAGSSNGTFLNDARATRAPLDDADIIKIGKFSLHIGLAAERAEPDPEVPRPGADDENATMVLTTDQLARVLSSNAQPAHSPEPVLGVVEPRPTQTERQAAAPGVAWLLAVIGALLVGLAIAAALF